MANRLTKDTVAEEPAQRASRRVGYTHHAGCPPFETRPAGAPQGEVIGLIDASKDQNRRFVLSERKMDRS
jgi:hypothetical protein